LSADDVKSSTADVPECDTNTLLQGATVASPPTVGGAGAAAVGDSVEAERDDFSDSLFARCCRAEASNTACHALSKSDWKPEGITLRCLRCLC
jgi:hypothetical protein